MKIKVPCNSRTHCLGLLLMGSLADRILYTRFLDVILRFKEVTILVYICEQSILPGPDRREMRFPY